MTTSIAFVGQRGVPPNSGGVERYVDEIVRRLPADEVTSYTYCRRHYVDPVTLPYTRQLFVPSLETAGLEAFSHSFLSALDCLRHDFDLVHFQALGPSLFAGIPKLRGARIVTTVHGLDWDRAKWGWGARTALKGGDAMMGRCADAIISVSKNLQRYYQEKYRTEVHHIPIGFSEPCLLPMNKVHQQFGLEPGKYLLFLNRIVPEKGAHYVIEAFKQIRRDDFKLVIAGGADKGDPYLRRIKAQAADDPRILFTGYVARDELHELYSNAYLFVLPSELEGMPAVLLEAMSHRCPVLVSDIPENLDVIVRDEETYGFVHKDRDVEDLRKQLEALLEDPERISRMASSSCRFVHCEYSWDRSVKMTYDVYKQVLNNG